MDCMVHGVAKSQTRLSDFHFHFPQEPGAAHWRSSQRRAQQKLEEKLPPPVPLQCILLTKINTATCQKCLQEGLAPLLQSKIFIAMGQ